MLTAKDALILMKSNIKKIEASFDEIFDELLKQAIKHRKTEVIIPTLVYSTEEWAINKIMNHGYKISNIGNTGLTVKLPQLEDR